MFQILSSSDGIDWQFQTESDSYSHAYKWAQTASLQAPFARIERPDLPGDRRTLITFKKGEIQPNRGTI